MLVFPAGKAGNVLRGALGTMLGEGLFAPRTTGGPSGLADPPRPFVFRAAHLDGVTVPPGADFHFDLHLFDLAEPVAQVFEDAFAQLARKGIGPGRGRAALVRAEKERVAIDLDAPGTPAGRVRVQFVTPTELKGGAPGERPEFPILFARLRDRISTLRALYGPGPLDIDFRGMGERAARVRLERSELRWTEAERRSSRTGQVHPLGGFTGEVEYTGELGEFLPYLGAGQWTGVGRQTVWGKGEICLQRCW